MNRQLSQIQSAEFYAPELDPTERATVLTEHNAIAIDAGFMRLAHVICDKRDNGTENFLASHRYFMSQADAELFSDIPTVTRPRFNRNSK